MREGRGSVPAEAANDEDYRLRGLYLRQLHKLCATTRAHWKDHWQVQGSPMVIDVEAALRHVVISADASADRICTHDSVALLARFAQRMQSQSSTQNASADVHLLLQRKGADGLRSAPGSTF